MKLSSSCVPFFLAITSVVGLSVSESFARIQPAGSTSSIVQVPDAPFYFALRAEDGGPLVAWYREVLGLDVVDTFEHPEGLWTITNLASPTLRLEIVQDSRGAAAQQPFGVSKVGFAVPDVEQVARRYAEAFGESPDIVDFEPHGLRLLQLRDPEGNVLQLSSPLTAPD